MPERLQASAENRHRGCERDILGQTVPCMGSNRECPIATKFFLFWGTH